LIVPSAKPARQKDTQHVVFAWVTDLGKRVGYGIAL
jgi:hypothetical protein